MTKVFHQNLFLLLAIILILSTPMLSVEVPTLIIEESTSFSIPLSRGTLVVFRFIHSSERTPWIERWIVNASGIYVEEICFSSEGAGHPSSISDFGRAKLVAVDGLYCFKDIGRYLGKVVVLGGRTAINMSLSIDGNTFAVRNLVVVKVSYRLLALLLVDKLIYVFRLSV